MEATVGPRVLHAEALHARETKHHASVGLAKTSLIGLTDVNKVVRELTVYCNRPNT